MILVRLLVMEIGEETDDGRIGAELRQTDKERSSIDQYALQSDLLFGEETGEHDKGGEDTYGYSEVRHDRAAYGLLSYNAHYRSEIMLFKYNATESGCTMTVS